MTRFLIYLFPAMMDMVLGTAFFVATLRLAENGASAMAVSGIITTWALVYMIVSQLVGSLATPRNSASMLICSSLGMTLIAVAFIFMPGLFIQYILIGIQAVATAFFFVAFQVFMKAVAEGRSTGIAFSTGLYTFSWSTGMACGPFVSGFIWTYGNWQLCYVLNAALGIMTAVGIIFLRHHAEKAPEKNDEGFSKEDRIYSGMPDFAWLGWVATGVCSLAVSLIRGVFPSTGTMLDISKADQGMVLAILSFAQALTGLALCSGKTWMYRALPVALFGIAGIAGLLVFAIGKTSLIFYIGALSFGIYSGGLFFYLVFHSLIHPQRSARYVAVNETVIGFTGIAGPVLGGMIADHFNMGAPYLSSALLVFAALILQVAVHSSSRGKNVG